MPNNMQKNSALSDSAYSAYCNMRNMQNMSNNMLQYAQQYAKYAKQYAEKYAFFCMSRGFNVISTESQAVPKRRLTSACTELQLNHGTPT